MTQLINEKRITGRFVLFALVLFFALIASVNALMATLAIRTFGGVEAENPYRAGLQFSKELRAARLQQEGELKVDIATVRLVDGSMQFRATVHNIEPAVLSQTVARIELQHPADRRYDKALVLVREGATFFGNLPVASGQWNARLLLENGGEQIFRSNNRMTLP